MPQYMYFGFAPCNGRMQHTYDEQVHRDDEAAILALAAPREMSVYRITEPQAKPHQWRLVWGAPRQHQVPKRLRTMPPHLCSRKSP